MIPVPPGLPGSPGGPLTPAQSMFQAAALGTIGAMSPVPVPVAHPAPIPAVVSAPSAPSAPSPAPAPPTAAATPPSTLAAVPQTPSTSITMPDWTDMAIYAAMGVGALAGGYHGYRRNVSPDGRGSLAWGAVWAVLGAAVPPVTILAAVLQGYAKPSDSARIERVDATLEKLAARYPLLLPAAPAT
jgi:hypothetical protein